MRRLAYRASGSAAAHCAAQSVEHGHFSPFFNQRPEVGSVVVPRSGLSRGVVNTFRSSAGARRPARNHLDLLSVRAHELAVRAAGLKRDRIAAGIPDN